MRVRSTSLFAFIVMPAWFACSDPGGRLYVEISSTLTIPADTNALTVRVMPESGALAEKSYPLGDAPRNVWPQVLPIVADHGARNVTITAEALLLRAGMPSVVVGFGTRDAALPNVGEDTVALELAPACVDEDGDGYGVGFGCTNPDCDDTRDDVPSPIFCPQPNNPRADGGVRPDLGPYDGGDESYICELAGIDCPEGQVCFSGACFYPCEHTGDCTRVNEACLESLHVCICRVPCFNVPCAFGECIDGCCAL